MRVFSSKSVLGGLGGKEFGDELSKEEYGSIQEAFTLGRTRNMDVDPRFALIVLSEIADRSLATSCNDTGTSIRVMGVLLIKPIGTQPCPPRAETGNRKDFR